jgi:hypothetical protein
MYHRGSTSKPSIIYFSRSSRYNVIHETQLIFKELYIHYSPLLHLDATYLRVETQKHMVFHLFLFLYIIVNVKYIIITQMLVKAEVAVEGLSDKRALI